ncbi:hypothetical protein [Emticicia sp. BO119]|uniref:hypothetical protein n=1 Tax=Emticicia sp. BO119 TaxID=2757768 RepID=UPI0015F00ADE|nr:hypothetical protein [Emticicia sp. BO119]MBA4849026.1 hypothetical protein [Emticicia sp. BO119]
MKHTFLTFLLLISTLVFGQTKYTSLNDACDRNQSGSGVTNLAKTIYIPSVAVNQYAFLNNSNRNFRRLPAGYYYYPSTNSAFQTSIYGKITAMQTCTTSTGTLNIVNQFATGLTGDSGYQVDNGGSYWYYQPSGEYWSNVSITPTVNNKVSVALDTRGFGSGSGTVKYKVENSLAWLTKTELEAIDFSNMKGKDVSIMASMFNGSNQIEETKQSIVHFAGDNTSKVPTFYKRNSTNRLPQLPYVFPTFSSLTGKLNILGFGQLDGSFNFQNQNYLTRGFNILDWKYNASIPVANRIGASYDEWAYDNGCPSQNGPAACNWIASTPIQTLYGWFNSAVISAASGYQAYFLDFEAWNYAILDNQVAADKMASLFRAFKQANPNVMLMSYVGTRGFKSSTLQQITESEMQAENNKYNQTHAQVAKEFEAKTVNYINVSTGNYDGTTGYLSEYMDVVNAGDYSHFITHSWFYATIQEMELSKLHKPSKKVLPLFWSYVETVPGSDFTSIRRYHKKSNNQVYFVDYKVAVPFSQMYNTTAWGNFLGDGVWYWHDPYPSLEGFDYHGGAGKDPATSQNLPFNFSTNNGMMEVSTTIGYDYSALALYELSFNNDILTGSQPIQRADFSTNSGSSYYTGEDLKPASADYLHIPIVRLKKHPTLNEWLVLAVNRYNDMQTNQTIKVKIPTTGQTVDIVLNGQFTAIKRVKLE